MSQTDHYHKGKALAEEGRHREALEEYEKALDESSEDPRIWNNRGVSLAGLGRTGEAIQCFERALEMERGDPAIWNNLGLGQMEEGNLDDALEAFLMVLQMEPEYLPALMSAAHCLLEKERYREALEYYKKAASITENDRILNGLGLCNLNLGRADLALEDFEAALGLNPDNHKAWFNKGVALIELDYLEDALEAFEKTLEIDPGDMDALRGKGYCLLQLGRFSEGMRILEESDFGFGITSKN